MLKLKKTEMSMECKKGNLIHIRHQTKAPEIYEVLEIIGFDLLLESTETLEISIYKVGELERRKHTKVGRVYKFLWLKFYRYFLTIGEH